MSAAVQPSPRVVVKRDNFFSDRAYPNLVRAKAFHSAWRIGGEQHFLMRKLGRTLLRRWMRDSALDAVRQAREDAAAEAANRRVSA